MQSHQPVSARDFIREAIRTPEWSLQHANGRRFHVRGQDDGRYFLEEYRPNGRVCTGEFGKPGFHCWDDPQLKALLATCGPNAVYGAAREAGIDLDQAVSCGAGYGVYSRYFDSLEACAAAVNEALAQDAWYSAQDEAKRRDPAYREQLRAQESRQRKAYQAEQARRRAEATAVNAGLFKGCFNLFGPLPKAAQTQILAYLNAPSQDGWDAIHGLLIGGGRTATLWQAWCAIDPEAPKSRPLDAPWPRLPEPETLRRAIRSVAEAA